MARITENETKLIEYLQEQAQNLADFCEKNGINNFRMCGYTFYGDTGNIHVRVSTRNDTETLCRTSTKWKWNGEWDDVELTTYKKER